MFEIQRDSLLDALDEAHAAYHRTEPFGGPSVYFHLRTLEAARAQNFDRFAEYAYTMLAAWGMHRMGSRGSKMRIFEDFKASLLDVWPLALRLQTKAPNALDAADWSALKRIFWWNSVHGDRHIPCWKLKGDGPFTSESCSASGSRVHANLFIWEEYN